MMELRGNISSILDLQQMSVDTFVNNPRMMVEMFRSVAVNELTFIQRIAAFMGFLLGLVQVLVYLLLENVAGMDYIMLPVSGLIIGYFTNWIAIKMIFRPVWPHQYCNGRTAVIIKLWITSDMPWRQVPDISWYATRYWTIPCFFPCVIIFIGVIQPCKFVNLRCLLEIASSCVLMLPSMAYPCCLYHIIYICVCNYVYHVFPVWTMVSMYKITISILNFSPEYLFCGALEWKETRSHFLLYVNEISFSVQCLLNLMMEVS